MSRPSGPDDVYVRYERSRDWDADPAPEGTLYLAASVALVAFNVACITLRPDADEWNWLWAVFFAVTAVAVTVRMVGRWRTRRRLQPRPLRKIRERPHPFP